MKRLLALSTAATLVLTACDGGTTQPDASGTPTATSTSPTATASGSPAAVPTFPSPASPELKRTIAKFGAKPLAWRGCDGGFECATMTVPLDYDAPDGETITVSVIRLKARNQARRVGSLVMNPGGPGGSGIDFLRQAEQLLTDDILDRFDAVSFDPRGVGESTPVDCLDDKGLDRLLAADPSPDTPQEKQALVDLNRQFAEACGRLSGKLLPHIGTVDVAKDLDVLRTALGDDKLTYLGFSYGTMLGTRYAQQFADNVRALVLDGAVDPVLVTREVTAQQAIGFERALDAFLADCVKKRCAFAAHGDIDKTYDELVATIDRKPLRAAQFPGRTLGPGEALLGVAAGLYSREFGWPLLRRGLEDAYDGDGSVLLTLFDNLAERDGQGHYSNSLEVLSAVSCVDSIYPTDVAAYDSLASSIKGAPRFGTALALGSVMCAFWPTPPVSRAGIVRIQGKAPPIMVVGTTRDPATPYDWAQSLADQLPGELLTYDADGHTAYGYGRSSCVDRAVDAFLISLTVPKTGTRCA